MKFSYYRLMITLLLMGYEFFIIVSMVLNEKVTLVIDICIAFFLIRELCKEKVKAGGIVTFYKLYCLIYRRTDYYKLDRIRRELMYPEYYAEQEKRARYKLAELMLPLNILANTLDCKKWL